tara:strand:+ start:1682 stop:1924 length:243 start_codon:yes stop_codon:yes gene_type:complete
MANKWMEHVAKFWAKNKGKMAYSEALKQAKKTYKSGATLTTSKGGKAAKGKGKATVPKGKGKGKKEDMEMEVVAKKGKKK